MRLCAAVLAALILGPSLHAQQLPAEHSTLLWFLYSGDYPVRGRWGAHFDTQYRSQVSKGEASFYSFRPAVNFRAADQVSVAGGYAYLRGSSKGEGAEAGKLREHRLYEQIVVSLGGEKLALHQRVRMEQRNFDGLRGRENRFRYRMEAEIPLGASRFSFVASDEILINIGQSEAQRAFAQNRIYTAVGRDLGAMGGLELGYMQRLNPASPGGARALDHAIRLTWSGPRFD